MPQQAPMPQEQQAPQGQAPQAPQEGGSMPPGTDNPLTQMIVQTDQALDQIAQVIAKASPEAGQALAQIADQFRSIISALMQQEEGQQAPQASQMAPPETQGRPSMQSY